MLSAVEKLAIRLKTWWSDRISPRDSNGDPYELHHIGQRQDSPFAELTWAEHMGDGNNIVLHKAGKESEIDRGEFDGVV